MTETTTGDVGIEDPPDLTNYSIYPVQTSEGKPLIPIPFGEDPFLYLPDFALRVIGDLHCSKKCSFYYYSINLVAEVIKKIPHETGRRMVDGDNFLDGEGFNTRLNESLSDLLRNLGWEGEWVLDRNRVLDVLTAKG